MDIDLDPRTDCEIDKYHLDEEARRLPSKMQMYYEGIQRLQHELDTLRFALERETAVAKKDVRQAMVARGERPVQDAVDTELACMDSIASLRRSVAAKETEIGYYKAVVSCLDAKRSGLNNLVSLYIKEYYGSQAEDGRYRRADGARAAAETMDVNKALTLRLRAKAKTSKENQDEEIQF